MLKCKIKKLKNLTTTTHAQLGAFDYITNGENNGQWSLISKPELQNMIKQPMVGSVG